MQSAKLSALYAYVPGHCVFRSLFFFLREIKPVHSVCYLSDASETPSHAADMNFAAPSAPTRASLSADTSRGHNLVVKNVRLPPTITGSNTAVGVLRMVVRALTQKPGAKGHKANGRCLSSCEDAKRMLREIKLLKHLGSHANIGA